MLTLGKLLDFLKDAYGKGDFREPTVIVCDDEVKLVEMVRELAMEIAEEQRKRFVEFGVKNVRAILNRPDEFFVLSFFLTNAKRYDEPNEIISFGMSLLLDELLSLQTPDGESIPPLTAETLSKCAGILFFDLGTSYDDVVLGIMLEREIGSIRLNDNLMVLAFGKEEDLSKISPSLLSRVSILRVKST